MGSLSNPARKWPHRSPAWLLPIAAVLLALTVATIVGNDPPAATAGNPPYKLERVLRFCLGGAGDMFKGEGWGRPERFFTWTDRTSAKLQFSLPPVEGLLSLRMRLEGLTKKPELPWQPVEVWMNGRLITVWPVEKTFNFYAIFPSDILREDGGLDVELKIPRAASPKALGFNNDERVLGIACSEVEISKAVPLNEMLASRQSPLSAGR